MKLREIVEESNHQVARMIDLLNHWLGEQGSEYLPVGGRDHGEIRQ